MATVYSDIATIENAPTPGSPLNSQVYHGKERVVQAVYEASGLAANDVIRICKLRKGDYVLMDSYIMFDDLGTGNTMDIGDDDDTVAADPDRYADGIDTAAAAGTFVFNSVVTCIDNIPYKIAKDCWLTATNLVAAATGTIKFFIKIARAGA